MSQSLFYWITYSYEQEFSAEDLIKIGLNPYFIGLPILISGSNKDSLIVEICLNPYFIGLPILIIAV